MKIVLTGGRGYVGGALSRGFSARGWDVKCLMRPWRMPEAPPADLLRGADVLVHAGWDMRPPSEAKAREVNVAGSRAILDAAGEAGIARLVFISSLSAFDGCASVYGRLKCEVERMFLTRGGWVVRPGLVYGDAAGGMIGKLQTLAALLPVIPLPCAGARQFLVHEDDLAAFVSLAAGAGVPRDIYSVANSGPLMMREIVAKLALAGGHRPLIVPVPWQIASLGLRLGEALRLPLPVTSDNLLGLAKGNPNPDFNPISRSGFCCREVSLRQ